VRLLIVNPFGQAGIDFDASQGVVESAKEVGPVRDDALLTGNPTPMLSPGFDGIQVGNTLIQRSPAASTKVITAASPSVLVYTGTCQSGCTIRLRKSVADDNRPARCSRTAVRASGRDIGQVLHG
jgi:hypothetical protein